MNLPDAAFPAFVLGGATASGKTRVAHELAREMGLPILSADSMLVYQGMDIGTAKPGVAERAEVAYYGLDLVSPGQPFSTGGWLDAVRPAAAAGAFRKGVIVTGGTGLYVKALIEGLTADPAESRERARLESLFESEGVDGLQRALEARLPGALAALADPENPRRLIRALEAAAGSAPMPARSWRPKEEQPLIAALSWPRAVLHQRIADRVKIMFNEGLLEETRRLRSRFPEWSPTAAQAIGYAEAEAVLAGELSPEAAQARIATRTRQLAKRQLTWLRNQHRVVWINADEPETPAAVTTQVRAFWNEQGPIPVSIRQPEKL